VNSQRCSRLRHPTETNNTLTGKCAGVTPNERFLSLCILQESAIGTLINQHELSAAHLNLGMNAGNKIALDNEIVVLCAANIGTLVAVIDYHNGIAETECKLRGTALLILPFDGRQHTRRLFRLPEKFE